ncbi:hypothetical protein F5Y18DRAFT_142705 [Xylariaceae sp. FL1019]|nr:hypothetical protein F5Y18DRAFT_142705 [Xylariaceae sp. FL1019]
MTTPSTTIVPFASLPSCALNCGPLYDANGACVPPTNPSTDENSWDTCFCAYGSLQAFKSGASGVCDSVCTGTAATDITSIQGWFTSLCNQAAAVTSSTTSSGAGSTGTSGSGSNSGDSSSGGGNWASTHVNWIIFIVIVVVAIAGIWTGACIWRRKYLKKKDRLYELGKGLPSSVAVNTQGNLVGPGARDSTISTNGGQGMFMSGPPAAAAEEPAEKRSRWRRR